MNMRDKEFTSRTGGGPGGAADAGERNFAPGYGIDARQALARPGGGRFAPP